MKLFKKYFGFSKVLVFSLIIAFFAILAFDGYYGLGVNKINASTFLSDGTHFNDIGRKRFGTYIGSQIISNM